ncbi:unnamed protein product [Arctogadus glacialis]
MELPTGAATSSTFDSGKDLDHTSGGSHLQLISSRYAQQTAACQVLNNLNKQSKEKIPVGFDLSDSSMTHGDDVRQLIVPRLRRTKSVFWSKLSLTGSTRTLEREAEL